MATHYLYGTVLTGEAVAANNRGENIGNTTTLQKVFHHDDLHTSVSAEAIRFALRYRFQLGDPTSVNRSYNGAEGKLSYKNEKRTNWDPEKAPYIDDDLMGFMDAVAASKEREAEDDSTAVSATPETGDVDGSPATETVTEVAPVVPKSGGAKEGRGGARRAKPKGTTTKRPSPLAVGRAVSLRPYRGEISFNSVSGAKEKGKLSLYSAEMHTTEYQYSFGLNLCDVVNKKNIADLVEAIVDPPSVAGNHSRFAYDFSPASIVLRVTNAHSSRIQNCFEHDEASRSYSVRRLIDRVKSGDVPANELIIGGELVSTPEGAELKALNVEVHAGVVAAANAARARIAELTAEYKDVATKSPPVEGATK